MVRLNEKENTGINANIVEKFLTLSTERKRSRPTTSTSSSLEYKSRQQQQLLQQRIVRPTVEPMEDFDTTPITRRPVARGRNTGIPPRNNNNNNKIEDSLLNEQQQYSQKQKTTAAVKQNTPPGFPYGQWTILLLLLSIGILQLRKIVKEPEKKQRKPGKKQQKKSIIKEEQDELVEKVVAELTGDNELKEPKKQVPKKKKSKNKTVETKVKKEDTVMHKKKPNSKAATNSSATSVPTATISPEELEIGDWQTVGGGTTKQDTNGSQKHVTNENTPPPLQAEATNKTKSKKKKNKNDNQNSTSDTTLSDKNQMGLSTKKVPSDPKSDEMLAQQLQDEEIDRANGVSTADETWEEVTTKKKKSKA